MIPISKAMVHFIIFFHRPLSLLSLNFMRFLALKKYYKRGLQKKEKEE